MPTPVLPVFPAVSLLKSGVYTATRFADGAYVGGIYSEGAPTTFPIEASVQPASGKDLLRLPEGEHVQDALAVWTTTELRTRVGEASPDRVAIDGSSYEVVHLEDWLTEGGYFKAIVRKVGAATLPEVDR